MLVSLASCTDNKTSRGAKMAEDLPVGITRELKPVADRLDVHYRCLTTT